MRYSKVLRRVRGTERVVECLKRVARVEAVRLAGFGRSAFGAIVKVRCAAWMRVVRRRVIRAVMAGLRMLRLGSAWVAVVRVGSYDCT